MIFIVLLNRGFGPAQFHSAMRLNISNLMSNATSYFAWGARQPIVLLVVNYLKDPLTLTALVQGYEHGLWTNHDNSINNAWCAFGVRFRMLECLDEWPGRSWWDVQQFHRPVMEVCSRGICKNSWYTGQLSSWWYHINMHHFGTQQPSQRGPVENTATTHHPPFRFVLRFVHFLCSRIFSAVFNKSCMDFSRTTWQSVGSIHFLQRCWFLPMEKKPSFLCWKIKPNTHFPDFMSEASGNQSWNPEITSQQRKSKNFLGSLPHIQSRPQ